MIAGLNGGCGCSPIPESLRTSRLGGIASSGVDFMLVVEQKGCGLCLFILGLFEAVNGLLDVEVRELCRGGCYC